MISENDVRLMRQALLADEEGRFGDGRLIRAYLVARLSLNISEIDRKDAGATWLEYWGVPASVNRIVILHDYGMEPVFRIPATLNSGQPVPPVGSMEIPFEIPPELEGSLRLHNGPIEIVPPSTARRRDWLRRFLYG